MFTPGGTFTITENTSQFTGTLFQGSFTGNANWTVTGLVVVKGKQKCIPSCTYTLSGALTGTWANGDTYNGATTQLTFSSKKPYNGSIPLQLGSTFVVTPEPASLGLMGTGLIGIGWILKRKAKGQITTSQSAIWG